MVTGQKKGQLLSSELQEDGVEINVRGGCGSDHLQGIVKELGFHSKSLAWHVVIRPRETLGTHSICQVEGNSFAFYPCTNFCKST